MKNCHIANRVEAYRALNGLTQSHKCRSSATNGRTAINLSAACGAEAVTCTRSAPRKKIHISPQHAATVCWRKEKPPTPQVIGAADTRRRKCRKSSFRRHPGPQREACSFPTSPHQACPLGRRSEARQRKSNSLRHIRWQIPPQWKPRSPRPYSNTKSRTEESQFGTQM
jgi:hypothetical protein